MNIGIPCAARSCQYASSFADSRSSVVLNAYGASASAASRTFRYAAHSPACTRRISASAVTVSFAIACRSIR
jgi:hypothetical protein